MTSHADTAARTASADTSPLALRHVLVVGGTDAEWRAMSDAAWHDRVEQLGRHCASLGVPWLTIRVYGSDQSSSDSTPWRLDVDGCSVAVDPFADGRRRFAEAMGLVDPQAAITEATVAGALYSPADAEPDLVIVLGPPTQLPASLVWELAYAELVFVSVEWQSFGAADLAAAVSDFAGRRRRFGGLDPA